MKMMILKIILAIVGAFSSLCMFAGLKLFLANVDDEGKAATHNRHSATVCYMCGGFLMSIVILIGICVR